MALVPDVKAEVPMPSEGLIKTGEPISFTFAFTNVGMADTSGTNTVRINKASDPGTWDATSVPAGWTLVSGTPDAYFEYVTTDPTYTLAVGSSVSFNYTYTKTSTLVGVAIVGGQVVNGSGGETNYWNNRQDLLIQSQ
ncbi:MAG: hypothetical protein V9G04_04740 [Nocardioides sp.]